MDTLWDDPEMLEDEELFDAWEGEEANIIAEDDDRERTADMLLRERSRGLNEWDLDPEDEWYD